MIQWDLLEKEPHKSMYDYYRRLITFRKTQPALRDTNRNNTKAEADETNKILQLLRWSDEQHLECIMNFSNSDQHYEWPDGKIIFNSSTSQQKIKLRSFYFNFRNTMSINPVSTYRIQFSSDFTFSDFEKIIPYFNKLGIKTIYASPVFEAVPGSTHGYDGTDPNKLNPEIGTEEQLLKISHELKKRKMYWLQDIVPNHLAFHENNKHLMDVLRNGRSSPFARWFDILWDHPDLMKS